MRKVSIDHVKDLSGFRLLIAPACARAASHADDIALQALEWFRRDPAWDVDVAAFNEYNRAFHCKIADLCDNSWLAAIEGGLAQEPSRLIHFDRRNLDISFVPRAIKEHNAVINAIQAHDSETASRLVYDHVQKGFSRILLELPEGFRLRNNGAAPF
jgi:DNA-binding GntR family transcriptional regulator